jgi:hypothetical protein
VINAVRISRVWPVIVLTVATQREFSAGMRTSEGVSLCDPVMPVFDGLGG